MVPACGVSAASVTVSADGEPHESLWSGDSEDNQRRVKLCLLIRVCVLMRRDEQTLAGLCFAHVCDGCDERERIRPFM